MSLSSAASIFTASNHPPRSNRKNPRCREFAAHYTNPLRSFDNMLTRDWNSGTALLADTKQAAALPPRGSVDLYVCGFPCTPWSSRGKRRRMEDRNAAPHFATLRTLEELRPRAVLLENVLGLRHCKERVLSDLLAIGGYAVEWLELSPRDFGFPNARDRVYIFMCLDCDQLAFGHDLRVALGQLGRERLLTSTSDSHATYLDVLNLAPIPPTSSLPPESASCQCRLDPLSLCSLHICRYRQCSQ